LLAPLLTGIYRDLSGSNDNLAWSYESKWATDVAGDEQSLSAGLADSLLESRVVDLARRSTTRGPHRDDPSLRIGDRDGRVHASQGEQRTIVLALRLATFDLLRDTFSEAPILLLDDVFSELDVARSKALLERLPGAQVFITAARREDVPVGGRMWDVSLEEGASRVTAN
ncbi:MAG: DNA replication/repair protein RecF, partial [Acidimicrobiia bacterium]|nr:DNA replication/repair protein RecF [Acidimicrobiia bacterium]